MSDQALLGIEAGGTRTVALLIRSGNQPLQANFGPANLHLLSDGELIERFTQIRSNLTNSVPLRGLSIGMAGARTESDRERIRTAAAKVWPGVPCYATNDLETALAAAGTIRSAGHGLSGGGPLAKRAKARTANEVGARVLILSGTGSCCFGRTSAGKTLRYGGWGHILGDRGSGYDIGLRALRSVIYHLDCDNKLPLLGQEILRSLLLNEPDQLIDWAKNADKTQIAALAVHVFEAAAKRDKIALELLSEVARSLAQDGVGCAKRLVGTSVAVEFILSGGILQKQPAFARQVQAHLKKLYPKGSVTVLNRDSVWGAIELGKEHFGEIEDACPQPQGAEVINSSPKSSTLIPATLELSPTERRNPRSVKLDKLALSEAIELMVSEDVQIPTALRNESKNIERAVQLVVSAMKKGGRLFYVGAGSSGRLGVLDASEIPPTFRANPELVQGIIAGGQPALWRAVEGAEDDAAAGASAIQFRGVTKKDVVMGIAASGRTSFVWSALSESKKIGASTILLCFNPHLSIPRANRPNVVIAPQVGPEILTGSTRLKAGTATKMVLNIVTTLSMVRMGKVISNLMVDLNASNSKLRERAVRIVREITGAETGAAEAALRQSKWIVKDACRRLRTPSRTV